MENKKPIEIAVYMRVGNASQLDHKADINAHYNHKGKMPLDMQIDKLHTYMKRNNC